MFFLVHLILGLSASSLVTLQLRLMCHLCKPFPPQKPHILLVVLLCITYDHTHLKVDLHPAKTIQSTQRSKYWSGSLNAEYKHSEHSFVVTTVSGDTGKDDHHLTCDLIETTFQDHSPQDQVVETPTSKSQMIDDALVSDLV